MAVNVATLVASLDADTRGFQSKFDAADRRIETFDRNGRRATDGLDRGLRRGERRFAGLGRTIRRTGGVLVAAFGAKKIADSIGNSVMAAADLEESVNAVQVVLGEGADSFLKFGRDSSSALGITQQALNQAVVPMGAQLADAGIKGDQLSESLQELSTRAADVGSVMNADVNTVLAAFGSALRGEMEPARQFGVTIDAAAVQAEALASGLIAAGEEMDNTAKAQATLNLIMEKTASSAGDLARTADSLPNLMKRVGATATDLQAAFGGGLLGGAEDATGALLRGMEDLKPVLDDAGQALGEAFGPVLEKGVSLFFDLAEDSIPAMTDALVPAADTLMEVLTILEALEPAISMGSQLFGDLASAASLLPDELVPIRLVGKTIRRFKDDTDDAAEAMKGAAGESAQVNQAMSILSTTAHGTGRTMDELAASYMETRSSARDLTESVKTMIDRINEAAGVALDAESADIRFRDSLADLNDELTEGKRTLDLSSDAGRRNREAFVDAAEAALGHVEALAKQTDDTAKANRILQGHSRQLREAARAAGFDKDAITELLGSLNLLPDQIRMRFDVDIRAAMRDIERVTGAVARASRTHGIEVGTGRGRIIEGRGFKHGGRPPLNRPSLVGEDGPELFQPDTAGTVIPNGGFGGGGIVINNNISGSVITERDLTETIQANIRDFQRRNGRTGFDI